MGAARAVARHPKAVIAAWIVIALLAAPLFAKLHTVVKTEQYTLPPNSEAMKADKIVKQVMGGSASVGLVIVQGVDLHSNQTLLKLAKWGRAFNETLHREHLGNNPQGLPIILAEANRTIYREILANITKAAGMARKGYENLTRLEEAYLTAVENLTKGLQRLNETAAMIAGADRGYAEAYRGLLQLAAAANKTAQGLRGLDKAYVNLTDTLLGLADKLNRTAAALARLDRVYAGLAANITRGYQGLVSVLSNKTLVGNLSDALGFAWWQASRTYVIMKNYNGSYEAYARLANLTSVSPRLQPLPRQVAEEVYRLVANLVANRTPVDEASMRAAELLLRGKLPGEARQLLPVLEQAWIRAERTVAQQRFHQPCLVALYRVDNPRDAVETQLLVLNASMNASRLAAEQVTANAAEVAAKLLEKMLEGAGLPRQLAEKLVYETATKGTPSPETVANATAVLAERRGAPSQVAALAAMLPKLDPGMRGVLASNTTAALEAAARLFTEKGAPAAIVKAALRLLEAHGGRGEAARLAAELLAERLAKERPEAAALARELPRLDPGAQGVLLRSPEALAKAVAAVLEKEAAARGEKLPPSVFEEIARAVVMGGDVEAVAKRLALQLVAEKAAEKAGEEQAKALLEVLQHFDPGAEGVLARNHTAALEAALWAAEQRGVKLNITAVEAEELLANATAPRLYVERLMLEKLRGRLPPGLEPLVKQLLDELARRGEKLPPEKLWGLIEGYLADMLARRGLPGPQAREMAATVVRVARGLESAEEAAKRIAERILLGQVAPRLIEEMKGLTVSRSLDGFLVSFSPAGGSRAERASNIRKAREVAVRLLDEEGLRHGEVLASGPDLLMQEAHEYALRDAEKTSKISETATFIVLLLILESVFAVLLPYTGIVLGLLVGGALVYLAARAGVFTVDSTAQSLMITTALGLGADYAAYLVHRFREEVALGADAATAAERALSRAGPAIVASAFTVMIGFGSLLLGWDIAFLRGMGETIPVTVAATAAASLTLVPALLSVLGGRRWFWWPRRPSRERHVGRESKLMRRLHRHHWLVLAILTALMLAGAYSYATFKGSHDIKLMLPSGSEAMKALELLQEKYMPGVTDPIYVAVVLPGPLNSSQQARQALQAVVEAANTTPGVGKVLSPLTRGMERLAKGRYAVVEVIMAIDPYSDQGTKYVETLHDRVHEAAQAHGASAYVGGAPYATLEMDKLLHDRYYHRILPAAATLMILVFTAIFGSLPASIAALIVIMGAAVMGIAASTLLFQHVLGEQVPWFLNIVAMMAVLGVGMDYNSFFLARALEECRRHGCEDTETALARAVGAVGLFIIGLSLVVSSAYMSMITASTVMMRAMGFTLSVTILLAGLMASYLYTPLVIALLGEKAWWPWGSKRRVEH